MHNCFRLSSIINVLKCTNLRLRYFLFSFVNVSNNYGCKNEAIDLDLKRILICFHPRYIFRFFISSCMLSDSLFFTSCCTFCSVGHMATQTENFN